MSNWIKKNRLSLMLHLFAATTCLTILTLGANGIETISSDTPKEILERSLASGKWAIRFLIISLAMTPLHRYFGWRRATKLRKPAGLWAFAFAAIHLWFILTGGGAEWDWLTLPIQPFIWLGILGLLVLALMALTSNHQAMRLLKKNWKRLHRLVYGAAILVALHGIMATQRSKKVFVFDPNARIELTVYLVLIIILLALRLKIVQEQVYRFSPINRPPINEL